ncbi:glycosyltransferase family 39 protein [Candidatus Parcubacteria bacterium]|nr:glycosyltransferase family 39 protein [Patescibacteria group bacterium]MBU4380822.1 glycosyltransferase family 39 protein [Patescibacteria group bacterium]MCG2689487.1 glycosyltransferase family 39 protein [Candidatus Parcubacteria bacterium]
MKINLLVPIIVLAFLVRVVGINFGLPLELHPDEGKIIYPANSMSVNFVESLQGRGDNAFFNPHIFYYGGVNFFILTSTIKLVSFVGRNFSVFNLVSLSPIFLLARFITVLFATATVYFVYRLGRDSFGEKVGLLSALVLAFFPTHVINSHYFSPDIIATFFGVASIYFLSRRKLLASSIMVGLGIGTKYYPAILAVFLGLGILIFLKGSLKSRLTKLLKYTVCAIVVFIITNPHVILNFPEFALDIKNQFARNGGGILGSVSPRFFYLLVNNDSSSMGRFLGNSLFFDLGPLALLVVFIAVFYPWFHKNAFAKYLSGFVICYFCFVSASISKEMRWLMFEIPMIAILVGYFFSSLKSKKTALVIGFLFLLFPIYKSVTVSLSFAKGDTRPTIVTWVEENIPQSSTILSDPILVARSPFDDEKYQVFEVPHAKYNVNEAYENESTPNLDIIPKPLYVVTSSKFIDYYNSSDFRALFPTASQKWIDYYKSIESFTKQIKCIRTNEDGLINFTGPDICIYLMER